MRGRPGALLSILLLALLATACSSAEPATPILNPTASPRPTAIASPTPAPTLTPTLPPSTATPGERPQRGGILRLAVARGSEAGFDPSLHSDWYIHLLLQPVYDGLLQLDPRSAGREVMPGIAESWQMTDDGRAWLFRIRSGVRFHNGDPVDAETVRFNIDRAINPLSGAVSIVRTFLTPIKDIAVVDARTVRITTSEPWAAALTHLAHPSLRIVSPRLANRPPERLVIGTPPPSPTPGGLPTPTP
ncbi:MAG: hypothetical protein HYX97_05185, partial [Chloroflexi bacterium]|nr:hypothetical protein [Chloroflexota bacterium]